ncbi:uncharacterized protein AB9W97_010117 isoform 5-T5 [Spinachia spinachia]
MIGDSSPLAAALGVVLVTGLSLLSVLCLRCKNKSKIIHEEHQIYNLQTFQRGGSVFAVTQSKTVTRPNQITSVAADRREKFGDSATEMDDQPDYQNISNEEDDYENSEFLEKVVEEPNDGECREKRCDEETPSRPMKPNLVQQYHTVHSLPPKIP